uniref:Caa(3)-type oxidase, subunit IV n=1 Tax=Solibacter usitatus (strain Ellin6076) TaxID=234267 RepID=Q02BQ6_SOLUE
MSSHDQQTHIDSAGTYVKILVTLLFLTGLTTAVAYVDLGAFSTVVALSIAVVKMLLVALFFMHVRHSTKLTKLVVVGGLLWLGILLALTMTDYFSRGLFGVVTN